MKTHIQAELNRITQVTPEKMGLIINTIINGSSPKFTYFLFLMISVVIASVGIVNNSAAVIIGAMLISPLMTPIFGASLATVTGNSELLKKSLFSVFFGVFLAILAAFMIGMSPITPLSRTAELVSRTTPNILDLAIAAFAGIAGCIALLDDSVGASLPGVAIATSLAPPLGASGLSLAMGKPWDAWGAFLLFFTNFLAIFLVASLLFFFSGFAPRGDRKQQWLKLKKPFWVTVTGIFLVCIPLGKTLYELKANRAAQETIDNIFSEQLKYSANSSIVKTGFKKREGRLYVYAILRSPTPLSPMLVDRIEKEIGLALKMETDLIVRCNTSVDIVAQGTNGNNIRRVFEGDFISPDSEAVTRRIDVEKVLRESFQEKRSIYSFREIEVYEHEARIICLLKIDGPRKLFPAEVEVLERNVKKELNLEDFTLLVSSNITKIITSKRETNLPEAILHKFDKEERGVKSLIKAKIQGQLLRADSKALVIDVIKKENQWTVVAEIAGEASPARLKEIQDLVKAELKEDVTIYFKPSNDFYVNDAKIIGDDTLLEMFYKENSPVLQHGLKEK